MYNSNCYFERNYYSPCISKRSLLELKKKKLVIARTEDNYGFLYIYYESGHLIKFSYNPSISLLVCFGFFRCTVIYEHI